MHLHVALHRRPSGHDALPMSTCGLTCCQRQWSDPTSNRSFEPLNHIGSWIHLVSLALTWYHLMSLDFTLSHCISPDFTWFHFISPGFTWFHLMSLDFTVFHFISIDFAIFHVISFYFTLFRFIPRRETPNSVFYNYVIHLFIYLVYGTCAPAQCSVQSQIALLNIFICKILTCSSTGPNWAKQAQAVPLGGGTWAKWAQWVPGPTGPTTYMCVSIY